MDAILRIMNDRINTANNQCVEADYAGSDTWDTSSVTSASTAGASVGDSDKEHHREACRLHPRFVGPLAEDQANTAMSYNLFDFIE